MIFTRCIKSLNYIPFHYICSLEMRTNLFFFFFAKTHPKIAGGESITGRNGGTRACMGIVRVYVRQQGGHHRWHTWAQVLRGEAVKMSVKND